MSPKADIIRELGCVVGGFLDRPSTEIFSYLSIFVLVIDFILGDLFLLLGLKRWDERGRRRIRADERRGSDFRDPKGIMLHCLTRLVTMVFSFSSPYPHCVLASSFGSSQERNLLSYFSIVKRFSQISDAMHDIIFPSLLPIAFRKRCPPSYIYIYIGPQSFDLHRWFPRGVLMHGVF